MRTRKLGGTDLEVSTVAFGCWAIVGGFNWGPQDEEDSIAALRAAHEAGFTLFDTAEGYGDGYSEQLIGKALGGVRDEIVIASKVSPGHFAPDDMKAACDRSLERLGTDRIDLYQLHWPKHDIPIAETLGVLEELKRSGKILHAGVSNFGAVDLPEALAAAPGGPGLIASNQLSYSLLFRAIEFEVAPACVEGGVGILTYSSLMQGLLTGKFASADDVPDDRARTRHFSSSRPQARHSGPGCEAETFAAVEAIREVADGLGQPMADVSLAWIAAQPGVSSVIAGGRNADQARRNAKAGELELPADALARLSEAAEPLKQKLGPNPDMWQTGSRMR